MDTGTNSPPDPDGAGTGAYAERTKQVHEARGALSEAVAALTVELGERRTQVEVLRAELTALRDERDRAVADNLSLRNEVDAQRQRISDLEDAVKQTLDQMAVIQNMKVVRWTGPMRRFVYRLRDQRR